MASAPTAGHRVRGTPPSTSERVGFQKRSTSGLTVLTQLGDRALTNRTTAPSMDPAGTSPAYPVIDYDPIARIESTRCRGASVAVRGARRPVISPASSTSGA